MHSDRICLPKDCFSELALQFRFAIASFVCIGSSQESIYFRLTMIKVARAHCGDWTWSKQS